MKWIWLIFIPSVVFSYPRIDTIIPQTHTLPAGAWSISVDRKTIVQKKETDAPGSFHESTLDLNFGIFEQGRVGLDGGVEWVEPTSDSVSRALQFHLRVRANDLETDGWAVALGIDRLGLVTNKNDVNMISVNMQNKIGEDWIVGVGGYSGSGRYLKDEVGKEDPLGYTIGLWRKVQLRRGRLGFEYRSGLNPYGQVFGGLTLELTEFVYGTIGYGVMNNNKLGRDWLLTKLFVEF